MQPISDGLSVAPRRVKDSYLQRVLQGREYLVFDGAMGTMLQRNGLAAGELPELLCLQNPAAITEVHRAYVEAGSQVITTNTFGANRMKLGSAASVEDVFAAAVRCAREAGARYVAADIGPTGALLQPLGTMPFDEAYELFAEQARAAMAAGADLVIIETMTDLLEAKAAVLAAKECSDLPIFATMTFGEDGRTFLGTTPAIAARTLDALGVDALGINCSLGPADIEPLVSSMLAVTSKPVVVQANAGLPSVVDGETVYTIDAGAYAAAVEPIVDAGALVIGGCCGTDPRYISELRRLVENRVPDDNPCRGHLESALTSAQREVVLRGHDIAVVGERINPTGKKRLREALRARDYDYVVGEAIAQSDAGADLLDVNAGLPDIDEAAVLADLVREVQGVCSLPLQIDSSEPRAVEAAVRIYAGKPLINSVNGKQENLDAVLPIAAHYGCAVVGLTLDEDGIPPTAEGRFAIAKRIVEATDAVGIARVDVYIDCLVMSASTNQAEIVEILRAVTMCKERLGVRTVLGTSNVSFGLPARSLLNATFLAAAFSAGLDLPITNPLDGRLHDAIQSWRVLNGQDLNAAAWVEGYAGWTESTRAQEPAPKASGAPPNPDTPPASGAPSGSGAPLDPGAPFRHPDAPLCHPERSEGSPRSGGLEAPSQHLHDLVLSGLKGAVPEVVEELLATTDPMDIVNDVLIPALDEVGKRFEAGTFFLPQLMASAEAAKAGFETIRSHAAGTSADGGDGVGAGKGPIVLATVRGDIHDIGKNIVRMLLDNYGYRVIDLGRDVDPQAVVDAALANNAPLVGLSALMTTTVRSMEDTIRLLREQAPQVKVFVGGAVLTPEYAEMVGADFYAKDAAESTRIAAEVLG